MLKTVVEDWNEYEDADTPENKKMHKKWFDWLEKALKDKRVQSGEIGITQPSSNYETYIFKIGNDIYVDTANNHCWEIEQMGGDKVFSGCGADDGDNDRVHSQVSTKIFFNIRNGLIHGGEKYYSTPSDNKKCPICIDNYGAYVLWNNKRLCNRCYKGILGTDEIIELPDEQKINELKELYTKLPKFPNSIHSLEL